MSCDEFVLDLQLVDKLILLLVNLFTRVSGSSFCGAFKVNEVLLYIQY